MKQILLDINNEIRTERLLLRPYKSGDGIAYYRLLMDNLDHFIEEVEEIQVIKNIDDAEVYIRNRMVEWESRKRFVLAMMYEDRMIGQLWLEPLDWKTMVFGVGYFIEKQNEGKGLVKEAARACIRFLVDEIEAKKLEIHAKARNTRSWKIAEKLGFTKEAHLRNRAKTIDGELVDQVYYGLLKEEINF